MNVLKRYILNKALSYLFLIDDEPITLERGEETKKGAQALIADTLLSAVLRKVEQRAKDQLFNKSTHVDHIMFPKAALYVVSEIRKTLRELAAGQQFQENKIKKW